MAWVKLYTDILDDRKFKRARRDGHTKLGLFPWVLAFAKDANDGGRLTVGGVAAEPEDLASCIPDDDATPEAVAACLASCEAIGVLSREPDGTLKLTKWDDRQAKPSDSKSAIRERVKRHRDRRKSTKNEGQKRGVTPVKRVTAVTVTPPSNAGVTRYEIVKESNSVTPCNATEQKYPTGTTECNGVSVPPTGRAGGAPVGPGCNAVGNSDRPPILVEPTTAEREAASRRAAELRELEGA